MVKKNRVGDVWLEGRTIYIKVNPMYEYDIHLDSIGKETDEPGRFSMWGWINHLKDKNWFTPQMEELVKFYAHKICEE